MKKLLIIFLVLTPLFGYSQCPDVSISNDTLYFSWINANKPDTQLTSIQIDTFNGSTTDTVIVTGVYTSGSNWVFATYIGGTSLSVNTIYTQLRFYNNDTLKGSCNQSGALPVELIYATSFISNKEISINWATASEINADFFLVEGRVGDKMEWFPICFIPCTNTNLIQKYSCTFLKDPNTKMLIKLSQYDLDNSVNILKYFSFEPFQKESETLIKRIDLSGKDINDDFYNKVIIDIYINKSIKRIKIKS